MARKGIYPDSVKPGIPKLGEKPEKWQEVPLSEILAVVIRKADIEDNVEYQLVNAKRNREGIAAREVLPGKKILTKTQFFIKEGDFLIANRQIVHGACSVVPKELDGALVSNEYTVLHPVNGLLLDFLRYYTYTTYFQQTCFQSSVGVDVEKMIFRLKDWFKYKVHLPPEPEQRKIAQILSCWDKAIDLTEKLIQAKTKFKKGLMQQLLTGKKRFGEYGKENWEKTNIAELGDIVSGGTPDTNIQKYWNGEINWCTPTDITSLKTKFINETSEKISKEGLNNSSAKLITVNSLIVCTRATIGNCAINTVPISTNQGFKSIIFNKNHFAEFYYHWISKNKHILKKFAAGSTFLEISKKDFSKVKVPLISFSEQHKIASVLSTCDKEIEILNKRLDAFKQQKKGLMQKLLTGKVRVKIDQELALEGDA